MKSQVCLRAVTSFTVLSFVVLPVVLTFWRASERAVIAAPVVSADAVETELNQIVQKQSEAWNRGDISEFMIAYWNDERLTFSSSGKTQRGWKATYENYKKNYPDAATMGKLTFSELETQELSPTAMLMLGSWRLERAAPVGGNFSLVWKRIDGKWLIVHDHSSALK